MKEINIKFNNQNNYEIENSYKKLRRNIKLSGEDNKVIMFTGCSQGREKSSVALNLARSIAETGKRVLFIDADLRKSVLVRSQKAKGQVSGLSHYLTGQIKLEDIIYITNIEKLSMVFPGDISADPEELFAGTMFKAVIPSLKTIYDYIIIDTPYLNEADDAAIIAQVVDGAVVVIESGNVSGTSARTAIEKLEQQDCRILGVVLDKVQKRKSSLISAGLGIIAILLVVIFLAFVSRDKKGPAINFPTDVIYSNANSEAALWDGVTAYDSRDGDVSSTLMIESFIMLDNNEGVKVTYVAKDKSNNITKAERIMGYQYDVSSGNNGNTGGQEESSTQEEVTTGKPVQDETDSPTEESVTHENVPTESTTAAPSAKPVLVLKSAEATISAGGEFKVFDYVYDITDDVDDRSTLFRQICIDGFYDTSSPGNYEIYIYCVDSSKNSSNREKFILHVK